MAGQRETLLCHYRYDPLDRVVGCALLNQEPVQRYYRKNRLATEIQGQVLYSVIEYDQQLLAQLQRQAGRVDSTLLATDLQRSVLHAVGVGRHQKSVYSPYGHRSPESGLMSLLGFNGERRDPVTGHYLLGNGYRAFNPLLMRFNSPDSLSPFGKGGVNAYAYCGGDPVNWVDPTGSVRWFRSFSVLGAAGDPALPARINSASRSSHHAGQGVRRASIGNRNGVQQLQAAEDGLAAAASRHAKLSEPLNIAKADAAEKSMKYNQAKEHAVQVAPEGTTQYEKLISQPAMSSMHAERQLQKLEQKLVDAGIDLYHASRKHLQEAVLKKIRQGE